MKTERLLIEGGAKKVWSTENSDIVVLEFKDDAAAYYGLKKGAFIGGGAVNNKVSNHLFKFLEKSGIPTHFQGELTDLKTAVKKVRILPADVIVRNVSAGSLVKRLGIPEGTRLKNTVIEFFHKGGATGGTLINDYHIIALEIASREELDKITKYSLLINKLLSEYLLQFQIELIDFKLEFGRFDGRMILSDELSFDTCRFWDIVSGEMLDQDRFRIDRGGAEERNRMLLQKLMGG